MLFLSDKQSFSLIFCKITISKYCVFGRFVVPLQPNLNKYQ